MDDKAFLDLASRLTEISSTSGPGTERSDAIHAYNSTSGMEREDFHRAYQAVFYGEKTYAAVCETIADKRLHLIIRK